MKILITGATGFIGFHLARCTFHPQGREIVAAARSPHLWQSKYPVFQWISLATFAKISKAEHWQI